MDPNNEDKELNNRLQERLKQLPKVVQEAIKSADVEKRLRGLADTHKLHLDQWQMLENEVMLTLLGFQPVEDLQQNIKSEVGVSDEVATALATDISKGVFEPIRQELERELEHPDAKAKGESAVEGVRTQMLAGDKAQGNRQEAKEGEATGSGQQAVVGAKIPTIPSAPPVIAATPPAALPTEKAIRMPASGAYKPGEASATRKDVHDDPYREPPQ